MVKSFETIRSEGSDNYNTIDNFTGLKIKIFVRSADVIVTEGFVFRGYLALLVSKVKLIYPNISGACSVVVAVAVSMLLLPLTYFQIHHSLKGSDKKKGKEK